MRPRSLRARLVLPLLGVALPVVIVGLALAGAARSEPTVEEVRVDVTSTAEMTAAAAAVVTLPPADIRPPTFPTARDILDVWEWLSAHPDAFGTNEPDANGPGAGAEKTEARDYLVDQFLIDGEGEAVTAHYVQLLQAKDFRLHPGSPSVDRGPIPKPGPTQFANQVTIEASQTDLAVRIWLIGGRWGSSSGPLAAVRARFEIWRCPPERSSLPACDTRPQ